MCVCVLGGVETQRGGSRYFLSQILGWDAASIGCLKLAVWYRVLALGPPLNLPKGQKWSMILAVSQTPAILIYPGGRKKTASAIIRRQHDKPLPNLKMRLAPLLPLPRDSFHKCNSKESKGLHRKREEREKKSIYHSEALSNPSAELYYLRHTPYPLFSSEPLCIFSFFFSMTRSSKGSKRRRSSKPGKLFNILTGREKDIEPGGWAARGEAAVSESWEAAVDHTGATWSTVIQLPWIC